ncbi:hypothetical protein MTR_4g094880 [Medicago truncatula]|uniref:Uncharacterized protein n=1 Tax=Medicago truncatula TaxID=3880 RepID=A0A072UP71_MEDTR|nr:hypothetical protein MTR_4g094880 [Medicago truncatula]
MMGGGHMGKKSYQSQASSSSSMFNGDTRMMEKVQSMLKAKESGNDEVWRARLMGKKKEKKMNEVKMDGRRTDRDLVDVFCMKYEDVWHDNKTHTRGYLSELNPI